MKKLFVVFAAFVALAAAFFIFTACVPATEVPPSATPSAPVNPEETPPASTVPEGPEEPEEPENPDKPLPPDNDSEPEKPEPPSPPEKYTVTFVVDGEAFASDETCSLEEIVYPFIPVKEHCTAEWSEPVVEGLKITVTVVYSAVNYSVRFIAEGVTVAELTYTVLEKDVDEPCVPDKQFYSGVWEEYELCGGDVTVNAVYTPVTYSVEFIVGGKVIDTQYYDVENKLIEEPVLPEKAGFEGQWSGYSLSGGDIAVNAVYVPLNATEGLKYRSVEGGYAVRSYSGTDSRVVVPSEYNGKPVISIADEAFSGGAVEEVHVCENVQSIGYGAFYDCTSLKKVLFPESLTSIGECAFAECHLLESVSFKSGLQSIGAEAFARCGVKEVVFAEGIKEIGERAFYMCPELTAAELPDSLEVLGGYAFCSCYSLERVTVGKGPVSMGEGVFYDCPLLKEVVSCE